MLDDSGVLFILIWTWPISIPQSSTTEGSDGLSARHSIKAQKRSAGRKGAAHCGLWWGSREPYPQNLWKKSTLYTVACIMILGNMSGRFPIAILQSLPGLRAGIFFWLARMGSPSRVPTLEPGRQVPTLELPYDVRPGAYHFKQRQLCRTPPFWWTESPGPGMEITMELIILCFCGIAGIAFFKKGVRPILCATGVL